MFIANYPSARLGWIVMYIPGKARVPLIDGKNYRAISAVLSSPKPRVVVDVESVMYTPVKSSN